MSAGPSSSDGRDGDVDPWLSARAIQIYRQVASRGPLARCLRSDRSQLLTAIAFVAVTAAAGAMIVLALSQPPSFWPAASPSTQLMAHPAVHSMLHDMFSSLLTLARHFGL